MGLSFLAVGNDLCVEANSLRLGLMLNLIFFTLLLTFSTLHSYTVSLMSFTVILVLSGDKMNKKFMSQHPEVKKTPQTNIQKLLENCNNSYT